MKTLWSRLEMAYRALTAPRVLLYMPALHGPDSFTASHAGGFTARHWASLGELGYGCYTAQLELDETAECARQDAIENEQRQIAAGVRTTRQAEALVELAHLLTQPKRG